MYISICLSFSNILGSSFAAHFELHSLWIRRQYSCCKQCRKLWALSQQHSLSLHSRPIQARWISFSSKWACKRRGISNSRTAIPSRASIESKPALSPHRASSSVFNHSLIGRFSNKPHRSAGKAGFGFTHCALPFIRNTADCHKTRKHVEILWRGFAASHRRTPHPVYAAKLHPTQSET